MDEGSFSGDTFYTLLVHPSDDGEPSHRASSETTRVIVGQG
jgi:hypothetical protein